MALKGIDLKKIPGAVENGVEWMMTAGAGSAAEAKALAKIFIAHAEKIRAEARKAPTTKRKKKVKTS